MINGELFLDGEKVDQCSPRDGLVKFLYFLKGLKKPCILIAHNGFKFDATRIIKLAKSLQLFKEFKIFLKGFCDTLHIFWAILPERKKKRGSFKQCDLVEDFLEKEDHLAAHNALNDVLMLKKVAVKLGINNCLLYTSPSPRDRTRSRMPSSA